MGTGYRPPSREPKGRWARHIHAVRRQRNWSATRAFEELLAAGLPLAGKSRSAYLKIDSGERQPKPTEEPSLVQVYGEPQDVEQIETAAPEDPVAAAVDRLTAQMARIEERLADLAGAEEGRADALQLLLLQLVGRVSGNVGERERLPAETR